MNIYSVNFSVPLTVVENQNRVSDVQLEETTTELTNASSEILPLPHARRGKSSGSYGSKPKKNTANYGRASGKAFQGNQHGTRRLINMLSNRQPPTTSVNQGVPSGGLGDRKEINRYSPVGNADKKAVGRKKLRNRNKNDSEDDKYIKVKEANFRFGSLSKSMKKSKGHEINDNKNNQHEILNNTRSHEDNGSITMPSCLIFHDKEKAELQMKKMRLMQIDFPFCVSENTAKLFEVLFQKPLSGGGDVIFSHLIKERLSDYANLVEIKKFRGMGQLINQVSDRDSIINGDGIYSVMSISLLPQAQIEERRIRNENILRPDSFKLIQYQQFDGGYQYYFSYCRQSGDFYTEINAGIIPVEHDENGRFILLDDKTGHRFVGKDLPSLVNALEKMTGMTFTPGDEVNLSHGSGDHSVIPTNSIMFNIPTESVIDQEGNHLLIDRNINVFSPTFYQPQESKEILVLYRNTYVIRNNTVVFVSLEGEEGRVDFIPDDSTVSDSQYVLDSEQNMPSLFAQTFSFGDRYSLDKIAREINRKGLLEITSFDSGSTNGVFSDGANFAVASGELVMTTEHLDIDYNQQKTSQKDYNFCFSYNNNRLNTIDEHGGRYSMDFTGDDENPGFYQIANNTKSVDLDFYQRCGFNREKKYQAITINDMMYSKKYIKVPDDLLKYSESRNAADNRRR